MQLIGVTLHRPARRKLIQCIGIGVAAWGITSVLIALAAGPLGWVVGGGWLLALLGGTLSAAVGVDASKGINHTVLAALFATVPACSYLLLAATLSW